MLNREYCVSSDVHYYCDTVLQISFVEEQQENKCLFL